MRASTSLRLSVGALLLTMSGFAAAENAVTADSANVYAGPDSSYPEVTQLDADTPVQVLGCLDDWSWCDVRFEDNRGWVYAPDISYDYQGGYVPLYSYAPGLGIPVVAFSIDTYWGSYYHDRPWYAQRAEWVRRGPPHHQRPPGPRPSAEQPPREARMDRPRPESQSDRSLRLSDAERSRQEPGRAEAGRADGGRDRGNSAAIERRTEDHSPAPAPRAETRSRPPEHSAPQRDEEQSRQTQHAAPPRHEERPNAAPPSREEHSDHPQNRE